MTSSCFAETNFCAELVGSLVDDLLEQAVDQSLASRGVADTHQAALEYEQRFGLLYLLWCGIFHLAGNCFALITILTIEELGELLTQALLDVVRRTPWSGHGTDGCVVYM